MRWFSGQRAKRELGGLVAGMAVLALGATSVAAQVCVDTGVAHIGFNFGANEPSPPGPNCLGAFWCYPPELTFSGYEVVGACDPLASACTVRAVVSARFPGNSRNPFAGSSWVNLEWRNSASQFVGSCGVSGAAINVDQGEPWIQIGGFMCDASAPPAADTYTLIARACQGATFCPMPVINLSVPLDVPSLEDELCQLPPQPPPSGCGDGECSSCLGGGGSGGGGDGGPGAPGKGGGCSSGTSVAGGGATACPAGNGPGVTLRYLGGGAGHSGFPGSAAWNAELGRYWSHDAAERIVVDPDPSHVWWNHPLCHVS